MQSGRNGRLMPMGKTITLAALAGLSVCAAGPLVPGDQLWRFYADFGVTVVVPSPDLSGNGGKDVLVGSEDDTLYLVEGKGAKAGSQLWSAAFKSTVSAAAPIPDANGDGKPDAAGGDELGLIQALSGATGQALWKYLTFGTILSVASVPDANGDGVPDVAAASENDTVYCLSGKPDGVLGKVVWQFGYTGGKTHGPPGGGGKPAAAAKTGAASGPKDAASGANSLAVLSQNGGTFGVAVGTSADTVYCLALANGAPKWKTGLPGDVWKIAAFPDQDGDGISEVLAACGADMAYLLKGSTGDVLWSHPVSLGAVSVAVTEDMDGDGKSDALIGDGGGKVHCVSGAAKGADVKSVWTYDFGDTSSILSIAPMGDVDKDGKPDCAVGTSSDLAALLSGKGAKIWSVNLGGEVTAVADIGDVDGNGTSDMGAGSVMGFASALFGGGPASVFARGGSGESQPRSRRIIAGPGAGQGFGIALRPPSMPDAGSFDAGGRFHAAPRKRSGGSTPGRHSR
jgi:hypothetical protein